MPLDNDSTTESTTTTEKKTPEFDAAQTERVNEIVREAQGRAAKEIRQEATRLAEENRLLKEQIAKSGGTTDTKTTSTETKTTDESTKKTEDVDFRAENRRIQQEFARELANIRTEAQREKERNQQLQEEIRKRDKMEAIRTAMDSVGVDFVSRQDAIRLSESSIDWDEERKSFVVRDENGNLKYDAALNPKSLTQFYREFVAERPYLVKAQTRGGAGSKESSATGTKYKLEDLFGPKSNATLANELATKNIGEYRRMRALAKEQGLVR